MSATRSSLSLVVAAELVFVLGYFVASEFRASNTGSALRMACMVLVAGIWVIASALAVSAWSRGSRVPRVVVVLHLVVTVGVLYHVVQAARLMGLIYV